MKEEVPQHEHYLRGHKDVEEISKLSDKLAPPEETNTKSGSDRTSRGDGEMLDLDTGALKLPHGLEENEDEKRRIFGIEPVIAVILVLMLAFIIFIAYLVYLMPAPVQ